MSDRVHVRAHAKANLLLRVLAREADGYHGLETLFALLELHDLLEAERRPGRDVTIEVHGADVGPDADNLAARAAGLVLDATGRRFGVHLRLVKRIPAQAGLGGGSADAAAALHLVNHLAGQAVPRHELLQLAARLGSDVPFCASGAPFALAWGHGERLLRLPALPAVPALVVQPPVAVATPEAYGWVDAARPAGSKRGAVALDLESLGSWGSVARMAANDFESVVFGQRPAVRAAFEALAGTGPFLCRMSGSGSALLALYRTPEQRDDAARRLGTRHGVVLPTATLAHAAPGPEAAGEGEV